MSEHPYTVVVGVSGTSKSPTALTWAAAQAKQNRGRVIAVRAWRPPNPQATPSGEPPQRITRAEDAEREAAAGLAADVADSLGPDHDAEVRLVRGGKFRVLVQAAEGADLLVVDAPRRLVARPGFARRLIYAATCPIVVMPPEISGEPASTLSRVADSIGRSALTAAGTAGRPGYRPPLVS